MFGHKRVPSREDGVEIVVEELSTRMVQRGHDVICYNRGGHHVSDSEFDAGGVSDSGDYAAQLKKQADRDDRVVMTGFVQGRLLEAMSYGNCCVTSDIEECAAVMQTHGLTFPKGDVDGLQVLLQQLCDNPENVKVYQEALADFITQKYSWDDLTEKNLELYQ